MKLFFHSNKNLKGKLFVYVCYYIKQTFDTSPYSILYNHWFMNPSISVA